MANEEREILTVAKLIERLQREPPNAEVWALVPGRLGGNAPVHGVNTAEIASVDDNNRMFVYLTTGGL